MYEGIKGYISTCVVDWAGKCCKCQTSGSSSNKLQTRSKVFLPQMNT